MTTTPMLLLGDADLRSASAALWPQAGATELEERAARATWTVIAEPSDAAAGALTQALGAAEALRFVERAAHGRAAAPPDSEPGITVKEWHAALRRWRPRCVPDILVTAMQRARRSGLRLLVPSDEEWPEALGDLGPHAPIALWLRGDPGALIGTERAVSIVGARAATGYGEQVAGDIAGDLARDGVTVVSGGAYGIDGAAHRAALHAEGATVAIMAGGADRVYPAGHAHLLQRVAETGAVISEVAPGGAPTKFRFLRRNRLIAALGAATVVVEAATRSGSLSTAGAAAQLGRPLGAVPGSVLQTTSAGCHRILREYDGVCITCADDVRELMAFGADAEGDVQLSAPVDPVSLRVRDALGRHRGLTVEEVAARSGVAVVEAAAALGLLGVDGTAAEQAGLWRLRH